MGGALRDPRRSPVEPGLAILGRIGSECYGTPMIMRILERNGIRATFFLEVLASRVVNQQQMTDAYGEIVARGHDAQLHLHPVYYHYDLLRQDLLTREQLPPHPDFIGTLPDSLQRQLLHEGAELLRRYAGKAPVAFRAGSFAAGDSTLAALAELGIEYDSSFNAVALGKSCFLHSHEPTNVPWRAGRVWEVPITNFETGSGRFRGFKPLDIAGVSWPEMLRLLNFAERSGLKSVVFILHSFSFVKRHDIQFQNMRPDHLVIGRFEKLCTYLRTNSKRFCAVTFGERPQLETGAQAIRFAHLGWFLPAGRKLVQAVNRLYWI